MSRKPNDLHLETLRDFLLSRPFSLDGYRVTAADQERISFCLAVWLFVTRDLSRAYGLERNFSDANLKRLSDRLRGIDFFALLKQLKEFKLRLRLCSPYQGMTSLQEVKSFLLEPVTLAHGVLAPFVTIFVKNWSGYAFRDLNTITSLLERVTLDGKPDLTAKQCDDYVALEVDMLNWHYDPRITSDLRRIINRWFKGFSFEELRPTLSAGATTEVKRNAGRANKIRILESTISPEADATFSDSPFEGSVAERPTSRVVFVNKKADEKRLICPEPTVHTYWQHATADQIGEWLNRRIGRHIDLRDQDRSRELCLRASRSGGYSTVDLSSASDTVTVTLVRKVFSDQPGLLSLLQNSRTHITTLPNGKSVPLTKFAPMGSVLCFPVECIIFAAVCELACERAGTLHDYVVYGDDIIIHEQATFELLNLLETLHFVPNRDKSYGPYSSFLEACGMEAYCGVDVTPLRFSRKFDASKLGNDRYPEHHKTLVKFVNRLTEYGFFETRRELVNYYLELCPDTPFSTSPERGLYHPDPTNQHLLHGYDPDLQVGLQRELVYWSKEEKAADDIRYQLLLERYARTERDSLRLPTDRIEVFGGATSAHLSLRWVPPQ